MCTITYVDDHPTDRDWELPVPPLLALRTLDEYQAREYPGDVLIVHGGQREADAPTKSGGNLLTEIVVHACQGDRRAIVFSGGYPFGIRELRTSLAAASLEEDLHYLLLPAIQNLNAEIDIDALLVAKPEPGWRIDAFKRRHALSTLLALGVLCQAALLAVDPEQVYEDAAKLLGGREEMRALRSQCASPSAAHILAPQTWRGALAVRRRDELMAAVDLEWPTEAGTRRELNRLIDVVWTDGGKPLDARTLSSAFVELNVALAVESQP